MVTLRKGLCNFCDSVVVSFYKVAVPDPSLKLPKSLIPKNSFFPPDFNANSFTHFSIILSQMTPYCNPKLLIVLCIPISRGCNIQLGKQRKEQGVKLEKRKY